MSDYSYALRLSLRKALNELDDGERLLQFAVETERAIYEGRATLPPDLLRLLAPPTKGERHGSADAS